MNFLHLYFSNDLITTEYMISLNKEIFETKIGEAVEDIKKQVKFIIDG